MTLILNWLRGIILGWILSLIFLLIKRMLRNAFNVDSKPSSKPTEELHPSPKNKTYETYKPYTNTEVIDTIWIGMRDVDLSNNFGAPDSRNSNIATSEEIWTYNNMPHMNGITKITIKNHKISSWTNE